MKPCYGFGQNFVFDIYSTQREPSFFVKWHPLKTLIKNFACGALYINIPFYVFAYHIIILNICVLISGLPLRKFGLLSSFPLFYKIIYHSFLCGFFAWPFFTVFYHVYLLSDFRWCIYQVFNMYIFPFKYFSYCFVALISLFLLFVMYMDEKKEPEENTNWCTRFERKLGD